MAIPNLPGMMPDKRSWLYRNAEGFHSASIDKSTRNQEEAAEAKKGAPKSLADMIQGEKPAEPAVEIFNRRQKGVLFTEQPKSMKGLLSGGGVFQPAPEHSMRTNNMELGSGLAVPPQVPKYVMQEKKVCRF